MNQTIQNILKNEFEKRCERNSSYSLRAYARDLGFSAQRMSHILNGKRGLSRDAGSLLAKKLAFGQKETSLFLDLIDAEFARSKSVKEAALKRVKIHKKQSKNLDLDQFKVISHWTHLAILTLLETKEEFTSARQVAKALGIGTQEAEFALVRLIRLGMAAQTNDGRFISTGEYFIDGENVPNESIKQFHEQMLMKAHAAVRSVGIQDRDLSLMFMAIDPEQFDEAKKMISEFREVFDKKFSNSLTNKQQVYAFGMQFYKVSQQFGAGEKNEI